MSKIFDEKLFPLIDLPKHLPKKRGKRLSKATPYRWKSVGLAGVKLEVAYIQGEAHTSLEAVDRFNRAVTEAKTKEAVGVSMTTPNDKRTTEAVGEMTDKQVQAAHQRAKERLRATRQKKR